MDLLDKPSVTLDLLQGNAPRPPSRGQHVPPEGHKKNQTSTAFTLIELLLTLSLISLFFLGISQYYRLLATHNLALAAGKLHTTALTLQRRAEQTSSPVTLIFDIKNNCYFIESQRTIKLPPGVCYGAPEKNPCSFKKNKLLFLPNGSTTPGTLSLTNRDKTCFYRLTSSPQRSAPVRLYKYINNKWVLC